MRLAVVGNPENRRVGYFLDAASRLGLPMPQVIAWHELLQNELKGIDVDLVRIESPGENHDVETALVRRGALVRGETAPSWVDEPQSLGRIRDQHLWYSGFCDVLAKLAELPAVFQNPPHEIALMFDKVATRARLEEAQVRMPEYFGEIDTYEQLAALTKYRAFIKPRFGSSASGVIAYLPGARPKMTTSVEIDGDALYNSLKIRSYTSAEDHRTIIENLAGQGLFAEAWIPKASRDGAFDFRVVVIEGRATHVVMRVSNSPMTNLHLGNRRGDVDSFSREHPEAWARVLREAELASSCFASLYCCVDVALDATMRTAYVFEVNAFGDLLPGITADGIDTYTYALGQAVSKL